MEEPPTDYLLPATTERRWLYAILILFTLILVLPTFSTWFWIYILYLCVSLTRMVYRQMRVRLPA